MKIVFFGTPEFAAPFLDALVSAKDIEVIAVVTQPDKPVGRKQELKASAVKVRAEHHGIKILQPSSLKKEEAQSQITELKADAFVVVAYGKIIPQAILDIPTHGCLNVHPSLLPAYRGPSPMQWAIMNGDRETGVSIMLLDAGMDTGPILTQEKIPLDENETYETLQAKVHHVTPPLLINTLKMHVAGNSAPQPQNADQATITNLLTKEDGHIDWNQSAKKIDQRLRAFTPWPGIWTQWKRKGRQLRIKVLSVCCINKTTDSDPGTAHIVNDRLFIQTADNAIEVTKLQVEGRNEMSVKEFLKGYPDIEGKILN